MPIGTQRLELRFHSRPCRVLHVGRGEVSQPTLYIWSNPQAPTQSGLKLAEHIRANDSSTMSGCFAQQNDRDTFQTYASVDSRQRSQITVIGADQ